LFNTDQLQANLGEEMITYTPPRRATVKRHQTVSDHVCQVSNSARVIYL